MGNTAGFMEYTRCENPLRPEAERVLDFEDLHEAQSTEIRCRQALARRLLYVWHDN